MKQKFLSFLLIVLMAPVMLAQQTKTVKGTVVDQVNEPIIGASVQVNGTRTGTVTDLDGNFTLEKVPANAVITFSYIGMKSQEVKVNGSSVVNVTLKDDAQKLDEVVVIGYGAAKAKDLTSPISVVKQEEIASTPSSSPMTAMQGKVPGMNVVSSGTPGSGPTVTIRGMGSFTNSSPLYVVDGMFYDNIDFLNTADIQDITVLKDASAAAIYGVRAANGVVIITTVGGKHNQKAQVTYNGYVGIQKATNILKMCNSHEYATMLMEANADAYSPMLKQAIAKFGGDFSTLTFGADTDWYNELLRTAVITNHSLSINGGTSNATYGVGVSFLDQDGIMDVNNYYKRLNFRANVDFDATDWLKVGFNGVFSNSTQRLPNNAAWQKAFNMPGIMPIYNDASTTATPTKYASPDEVGLTANFYNPIATANYWDSKNQTYQVLSNFYAQVQLIPEKLNVKTSYSYDYSSVQGRNFTIPYYVSSWQQLAKSSLTKFNTHYYNYIWDNTLTYKDKFGDNNVGAMFGYSLRQQQYRYLWGNATNVPVGAEEYLYLNKGDTEGITLGDDGYCYRGESYFGRLNYDYAGKYYAVFTMRADGSSKYQQKWGYFPSVGAAWVITQEPFMQGQKIFDYMKLRASWGLLGNDHVAASDGFASVSTGNSNSGVYGNTVVAGYQNNYYYSTLKWEKVEEWNAGINFSTFSNRLNVDLDYFHRMTKNAVISPRLPFSNDVLAGNYGKILNSGADLQLTWTDRIGKDWKYNIGLNLSYLHNRVKSLSGASFVLGGKTVNIVGEEMNSFYGYKVVGIYQNAAEIAADPVAVANSLVPGDFKYEDVNKDGKIDGSDRQVLGAYIPNMTYGLNLGLSWKNLDFAMNLYAQTGGQLYNRKRALRYAQSNYNFDEAQYKDRWTGEGSTNKYPSAAALIKGWNVFSDNSYFVEKSDYFRIQNVSLAYNFKNLKMGNYTMPLLRVSLTADRPFTTFKAHSFTPELTDAEGWDTEVYPLTATYTLGVQINF
jgi:TonB-linked SusC/RagA family outer membrane protein